MICLSGSELYLKSQCQSYYLKPDGAKIKRSGKKKKKTLMVHHTTVMRQVSDILLNRTPN